MSEGAPVLRVVYDGQCPFCANFVQWYRLRENLGTVSLVDARSEPALVERLRAMGMEINTGMVVEWQGQYHFAADAMQLLAHLAAGRGLRGRLNRALFHRPGAAAVNYPLFAALRRCTLKLLGRPGIP